jgi:hypothetical protein
MCRPVPRLRLGGLLPGCAGVVTLQRNKTLA